MILKSIHNKQFFLVSLVLSLMIRQSLNAQVSRLWEYSFNPITNYEASGSSIVVLPSGNAVSVGSFRNSSNFNTKNILIHTDVNGTLLYVDTSVLGPGYKKVVYDGHADLYALATFYNDTLPISKILVAKYNSSFTDIKILIPDSGISSPGYDVLDMSLSANGNIVIASRWDAFPLVCLSLLCMDTAGTVLWERVDSVFQFSYDVKLLPDAGGGMYVAGSGKDTSNSEDFIFVSHYTSSGHRDWSYKYYSPAQFFADMTDMIIDITGSIYVSGNVMDSVGQVGVLFKFDLLGNLLWNRPILPLAYSRIISDNSGNVYGVSVPLNGIDVFTIEKLDSAGTIIDSSSFQLSGYFASELGDICMLDSGNFVVTGGLFVLSFPKSDQFLAAMDTSLNLLGYDIFDSLNLLGETGKAIGVGEDGNVYVCGRLNFENQFETSNIGLIKYNVTGLVNNISENLSGSFDVFPNPSTGEITFKWADSPSRHSLIRIFDNAGTEVFRDFVTGQYDRTTYQLQLKSGFYHAVVESGNGRVVKKVCIIR